ncbi:MAG: DUF4342 domain-containing protein [Anaerolineae bacterium]|nr:DUF4342 domain-containing protein [Anaerolineae bacterium]
MTEEQGGRTEEFAVSGEMLLTKLRELLHEGNIRRVSLKTEEGRTLIEVPLTIGVAGAVLVPVWAAIGAIAAMVARLRIVVERVE